MRPVPDVGGTADSVGNGTGHTSESAKRVPVGSLGMAAGQHHAPYQPPGRASSPCRRGNDNPYTPPAEVGGCDVSLSPRGMDFSTCLLPGALAENRPPISGKTPRRAAGLTMAPAARTIPASSCGRAAARTGTGAKKQSPAVGASHGAARKGEGHQRLALKKASILSKGMMSTRSYRSVCEAPGTISSSLLSPLSFLKASSLK